MTTYRNRTYCSRIECLNDDCSRRLFPEDLQAANEMGLPISYSDLKDSDECPGYMITSPVDEWLRETKLMADPESE